MLGVVDGAMEARARSADDPPRDAEARRGEAGERALHPSDSRQDSVLANSHLVQDKLTRNASSQTHLLVNDARLEPLGVGRDEEAPHLAIGPSDLCPNERELGQVTVGDPALGAGQYVAFAILARHRSHAAGVRAPIRFGQPEAPDELSLRHLWKIVVLLTILAERVDGIHDECPLDTLEAAHARISAFELLHHEAIADVTQSGAAVPLEVTAEDPQTRHLGDELRGESAALEMLADAG